MCCFVWKRVCLLIIYVSSFSQLVKLALFSIYSFCLYSLIIHFAVLFIYFSCISMCKTVNNTLTSFVCWCNRFLSYKKSFHWLVQVIVSTCIMKIMHLITLWTNVPQVFMKIPLCGNFGGLTTDISPTLTPTIENCEE